MARVHEAEAEDSESVDRSRNKFRFDRSINLGNLIALTILVASIVIAYNSYQQDQVRYRKAAERIDILWQHFLKEHNDITYDEYRRGL